MAGPKTSRTPIGADGDGGQQQLFGLDDALPDGWAYEPEFLSGAEEQSLIEFVQSLPLEAMRYKSYVARRRGISFGGHYDFDTNVLLPSIPIPEELEPLRKRAASWLGKPSSAFTQVLVAEYQPGTPLGWHRDVPDFEDIVGVSLAGDATLAFRRYPQRAVQTNRHRAAGRLELRIAPRSIYRITGSARWDWQHAVLPTDALRYVVTMRTPRVRRQGSPTAAHR